MMLNVVFLVCYILKPPVMRILNWNTWSIPETQHYYFLCISQHFVTSVNYLTNQLHVSTTVSIHHQAEPNNIKRREITQL